VIAGRDAAGELEIDHPITDASSADKFADFRRESAAIQRHRDIDTGRGSLETRQVLVERERPAAIQADDFVNAVGELKSAVFHADSCIGKRNCLAVHPN